ncbi:MAG: hypothetical protein A4E52_01883 [Pelotomaculum sp. PtaB.Bin013]|uniref:SHSP domain-containing protein n=1 Tax=Pelotomaculum isophthalicicum JI TaxID=947010 RepID=A0A9X4H2X3_9FIRM|nr:hypothetical protein [Pelotomaculum isophthalicicum]MDF9407593.1 hypothetical protein [Pelotomaculum isophthalicicum JI]OPX83237.1 MAG: hypothetical protein A4E52_01883 [Pelotomaculum sp. PtaB.Bin013]
MKNGDESSILGNVLRGIGELVELVQKMDAEGKTEINRFGTLGDFHGQQGTGARYGFTLRTGLPGRRRPAPGDVAPSEVEWQPPLKKREPVIDVFDEGGFIRVVAELSIASDDEVALDIKENVLNMTVETRDVSFSKCIAMPKKVNPGTMRKYIRNGILEVLVDVQDSSQ